MNVSRLVVFLLSLLMLLSLLLLSLSFWLLPAAAVALLLLLPLLLLLVSYLACHARLVHRCLYMLLFTIVCYCLLLFVTCLLGYLLVYVLGTCWLKTYCFAVCYRKWVDVDVTGSRCFACLSSSFSCVSDCCRWLTLRCLSGWL